MIGRSSRLALRCTRSGTKGIRNISRTTITHGLRFSGNFAGTNAMKIGSLNSIRTFAVDRLGERVDTKIDDLTDNQYNQISNNYLEDLGDELELIGEEYPDLDFELSQGVLNLNTPRGTYVINRQPPNKQMWLSSPLTGPNRYDLIGGKWVSLRDNGKLTELLSQEISDILGASIKLQLEN